MLYNEYNDTFIDINDNIKLFVGIRRKKMKESTHK